MFVAAGGKEREPAATSYFRLQPAGGSRGVPQLGTLPRHFTGVSLQAVLPAHGFRRVHSWARRETRTTPSFPLPLPGRGLSSNYY